MIMRSNNNPRDANRYRFTHHGLENHAPHRGECGIGIILSPTAIEAYLNSNESPPLTSSNNLNAVTSGRLISINLSLKLRQARKKGVCRKKSNNNKFFHVSLTSTCYPHVDD